MTSNNKFLEWLDRSRQKLSLRKEDYLLEQNRLAHKEKASFSSSGSSGKVVESFVAPPSFLLYLWASFPLIMVGTFQINAIIGGVIATAINFFLIHIDSFHFVRYILCGVVLITVIMIFHFNVIELLSQYVTSDRP